MAFALTSTAFTDGTAIPAKYTCDEADVSPPLAWSGAPPGTVSFALIVDDPDAPARSEEHTSELQSRFDLVCRLLLEKKKKKMHKQDRIDLLRRDMGEVSVRYLTMDACASIF